MHVQLLDETTSPSVDTTEEEEDAEGRMLLLLGEIELTADEGVVVGAAVSSSSSVDVTGDARVGVADVVVDRAGGVAAVV